MRIMAKPNYYFRVFTTLAGMALIVVVGLLLAAYGTATAQETADDTKPPETTIDSGPLIGKLGSASFSISGLDNATAEADLTFQCSLDGAAFSSCPTTDPMYDAMYTGLSAEGLHKFEVKATDGAGNTDQSPASRSWTEVVDNADMYNSATQAGRFWISTYDQKWYKSTSTQAYGADKSYRYRTPTGYGGYYPQYKVKIPTAGDYDICAQWPGPDNPGNNPSTAFWIWTTPPDAENGNWQKISKDQRKDGGHFVKLGTFPMAEEDDWDIWVDDGYYSSKKGYMIADAVRIVPHQTSGDGCETQPQQP